MPSHSVIPRHYSIPNRLSSIGLQGEKACDSQETSHSQVFRVTKLIFLFKKCEDYMLVAVHLLAVPAKKSFQTSDCFSDDTTFFKKKNKTKLQYREVKHFVLFSSEDIRSLIAYQPTDTWQPASLRSTAFGSCSLQVIFSPTAQKPQENVIVECQVKFKAKHKLKCKTLFHIKEWCTCWLASLKFSAPEQCPSLS